MTNLRRRLRQATSVLRKSLKNHPKHAVIGFIACGMLGIYAFSKAFESERKVIHIRGEGKFEGKRIIGDISSSVEKAKEAVFVRTANDLLVEQKANGEKLDKIVELLGQKTAGDGESPPATRPEDKPDPAPPQVFEDKAPREAGLASTPVAGNASFATALGGYKSPRGPAVIAFPTSAGEVEGTLGVALPSGSYVKAKMLTGIDSPTGRTDPVLVQLDYAYILPNRQRLDLSGCFMILKAQGDLPSESATMQATKMSCVAKSGRFFERTVNGFVVDDIDNVFGVRAEVRSKQDRKAALAFVSSIVEGVGKAIQETQVSHETSGLGVSQSIMTGDEKKFLVAGGASHAASVVSQWYLKQAENLLPTLKVGSGREVWVVMLDSVSLPNRYFKKGDVREKRFSYVTRLLD